MTKIELDSRLEKVLKSAGRLTVTEATKAGISQAAIYKVFGGMGALKKYAKKRFPKLEQNDRAVTKLDALKNEIAGLLK